MNKTLKEIGHVLFSVFVMPFIFFIVFFVALIPLIKDEDGPPPDLKWELRIVDEPNPYDELHWKDDKEIKEDYDGKDSL